MNGRKRKHLKSLLWGGSPGEPKRCWLCRCPISFATATLDHVVPVSRGGTHTLNNVRLCCAPCNVERGNRNAAKFRKRKLQDMGVTR